MEKSGTVKVMEKILKENIKMEKDGMDMVENM